jgi:hypothetical protein
MGEVCESSLEVIYFLHVSFLNSVRSGIEAIRKFIVYTAWLGNELQRAP